MISRLAITILTVALLGAGASTVAHAITAEQCDYFQVGGKVAICHATGSVRTPYVRMVSSVQACEAHAAVHPDDYIAASDPQCQGGLVCLSENAPCDATLPCCDGLTCGTSGVCTSP